MKKSIINSNIKTSIKKITAFLLIFFIILPVNTASASVIFEKLNLIPTWTGIPNLNENVVNKLNQYLFQNRNLWTSSSILENWNNNILELDNIYKSHFFLYFRKLK